MSESGISLFTLFLENHLESALHGLVTGAGASDPPPLAEERSPLTVGD
jgi:hypothetical protein